MYTILFSKTAIKDLEKLKSSGFSSKAKLLVDLLTQIPFECPPSYEKLVGDLSGAYSRRINIQHRLVYSVDQENKTVKILRMWTHYE